MRKLFTERRDGSKPRTSETLSTVAKQELLLIISEKFKAHWFGFSFPGLCPDGDAFVCGTNYQTLKKKLSAYDLPDVDALDSMKESELPSDDATFDLLEFSFETMAEAKSYDFHSYFRHDHYNFDQESGRAQFTKEVNRVFERCGIAFELKDGEITRLAAAVLHESLERARFRTGDAHLDGLLDTARQKFLSRSLEVRKEALEKLWDGWERLKTLEATDKKTSATILLDKASAEPTFRARLETEARELTDIGNKFMIRHSETDKVPITDSGQVDYLFHRMFALIDLLLRKTGRLS